ncbi:hypothetical protein BS47DRAFT_1356780 [Hydnum rufescens UP504]|uniref:Uncharacterized protein n=1 Tax=Hydnum rufescens UP504 TaxID=1448309 RepID=A0A9P6AD71_9AGAM|nr:hypothetical protein BS47DRAFT_1356780 [Hydnum rufescens UP504]
MGNGPKEKSVRSNIADSQSCVSTSVTVTGARKSAQVVKSSRIRTPSSSVISQIQRRSTGP